MAQKDHIEAETKLSRSFRHFYALGPLSLSLSLSLCFLSLSFSLFFSLYQSLSLSLWYVIIIIIIMLAYLYCAAYTRMTMKESSPPCEQRRITFNDDGQRVQLAQPELPAPHYICMYRLLPITSP